MYVSKILIDKMMEWFHEITPNTPSPTIHMAFCKLAALCDVGILSEAEYIREVDELIDRIIKKKKTKDETEEMFQ